MIVLLGILTFVFVIGAAMALSFLATVFVGASGKIDNIPAKVGCFIMFWGPAIVATLATILAVTAYFVGKGG